MRKWLIGIVLLVLVLGGLVLGGVMLRGAGASDATEAGAGGWSRLTSRQPGTTEVMLREAVTGDLARTVAAPGSIEPRTNVAISAQVSARIIALPFREGDTVEAGDVMVRLDARDLAAALASAEAQLKSEEARLDGARAGFIRAQAAFGRARELFDSKDIAKADLDMAEAEYLSARSQLGMAEQGIEIAKAAIAQREKDLDNAIITSPIAGTITNLNTEVGETVIVGTTNNPGSIIMEIADLGVMLLKAQVDETNMAAVEPGQRARVYINAYPDITFEGHVQRIGLKRQVAQDGVGYFDTEILLEPHDDAPILRSGLTANTEIEVERLFDVVKVPSQAVLDRRIDELPREVVDASPHADAARTFARVVFVMTDAGEAHARPVRTGPSDLTETAILAGLEAGERVVVGPFRELVNLKHGQKLRDRDAPKPTATSDDASHTPG
ncbi:MAG: efflux RND transporter periplasmic adaptor subunit [Phycisphaerales bacterium]|nr:MAG: efflux RND transporter periplasmic adaptor subunit [Phycisphaerales bacterium]